MAAWIVTAPRLPGFLAAGSFAERAFTVAGTAGLRYVSSPDGVPEDVQLTAPRAAMSVRSFCFPPKELVARYAAGGPIGEEADEPQRLVVGLRACELSALRYLDRVFEEPPVGDPFYQKRRQAQTCISVDCVQPHGSCFCNLVEGAPYAAEGFDVNLTPISGAYVVEAGSDAGQAYVDQASAQLTEASSAQLEERDQVRRAALEQLESGNAINRPARPVSEALAGAEDSANWDRLGHGCVECGACTQICPTCHCFYLLDRGDADGVFRRLRAWDSCMWSGYSRMAGAAGMKPNPRYHFRSRFANRFLHKYLWSPQQWNLLGCVGCGRCTEACPGRIDIRTVIREMTA